MQMHLKDSDFGSSYGPFPFLNLMFTYGLVDSKAMHAWNDHPSGKLECTSEGSVVAR